MMYHFGNTWFTIQFIAAMSCFPWDCMGDLFYADCMEYSGKCRISTVKSTLHCRCSIYQSWNIYTVPKLTQNWLGVWLCKEVMSDWDDYWSGAKCQIQKYKYTNTQIHKYTKTKIQKYTNTHTKSRKLAGCLIVQGSSLWLGWLQGLWRACVSLPPSPAVILNTILCSRRRCQRCVCVFFVRLGGSMRRPDRLTFVDIQCNS